MKAIGNRTLDFPTRMDLVHSGRSSDIILNSGTSQKYGLTDLVSEQNWERKSEAKDEKDENGKKLSKRLQDVGEHYDEDPELWYSSNEQQQNHPRQKNRKSSDLQLPLL